jgi:uroporphyrinogen decarboxylase
VKLKREFGDELSFWGAIDTQNVLPYGTVGDVEEEVGRRIQELAVGGGYLLTPTHNTQPDVPVENFLAVFRHAQEVGRYPLIQAG